MKYRAFSIKELFVVENISKHLKIKIDEILAFFSWGFLSHQINERKYNNVIFILAWGYFIKTLLKASFNYMGFYTNLFYKFMWKVHIKANEWNTPQ